MARNKNTEESAPGAPAWTATFADLMNLLLCFFVVLFSLSAVDSTKFEEFIASFGNDFSIFSGGESQFETGHLIANGLDQVSNLEEYTGDTGTEKEDGKSENASIFDKYNEAQEKLTQELYDDVSEKLDKNKIADYVELSSNSPYVKLSLNGAILFDSGQAKIKEGALPILSRVGDILKTYNGYQIEIEGHTDNVPIHNSNYKNNLRLSTDRASNVLEYLIEKKNLNPKYLSSTGRAEYDPVASNSTEEGRAKNRRVEIKIYNKLSNK